MTNFQFANPEWIHATWIVLAIVSLLILFELHGRSALDMFLSKLMQNRLIHRVTLGRRLATIACMALSMILLTITLMQPQWGRTVQSVTKVQSQVMICLDVSKSMLAEDVAPSRLERAKVELDSLLGLMDDGQQVGLIGFAGKSTVLCPMTTDFGFLRLILQEASPSSVGLGGTKIGDAIRKAIDGFGEAGDINRLILLLTDGEDHDSFPLEVAAAAREKGIKIISIGFGDEAGSKIETTNLQTGTRVFIKDVNGNDVVTRLDGDTLRELAMETEGAYIPAGTGALDLESIYNAHIKSLLSGTTEETQRVFRNEAFQWPLLAAIVVFMTGLFISTPLRLVERAAWSAQLGSIAGKGSAAGKLVTLILFGFVTASSSFAQQPENEKTKVLGAADEFEKKVVELPDNATPEKFATSAIADDIEPRDAYNQSLPFVAIDPDRAEQYLNRARRNAGADGEVRYRSLFNLGWVEVNRADKLIQEEPKQALVHLQQAANRFRESIRVRSESDEARHNLEIVSRRILELADSLHKKDPRDLAARLDPLIQQTREHLAEIRILAQQFENGEGGASPFESLQAAEARKPFRNLGVTQRQIISDLQRFSDDAGQEIAAITAKEAEQQTEEERVRVIQTNNMLLYINSCLQRMNKARSLTRRHQGVRGFQRWAAALSDAKRARDQLRNPVEIIGQLVTDASELYQLTQDLNQSKSDLTGESQTPAWLTTDYLSESQTAIFERNTELNLVLEKIADSASKTDNESSEDATAPNAVEMNALIGNIREALPLLDSSRVAFESAGQDIVDLATTEAIEHQSSALKYLSQAWELFFDIRRLIEATYRDENIIGSALEIAAEKPEANGPFVAIVLESQKENLQRSARLAKLILLELKKLDKNVSTALPSQPGSKTQSNEDQSADEKLRLDAAAQILQQVVSNMEEVKQALTEFIESKEDAPSQENSQTYEDQEDEDSVRETDAEIAPEIVIASDKTGAAIEELEKLRRLFFSLIEHLKDTAKRQTDVNDDTQSQFDDLNSVDHQQIMSQLGPISNRQKQLQAIAEQISGALAKQAETSANPAPTQSSQHPKEQDATGNADRFKEAGKLVKQAAGNMDSAISKFEQIFDSQVATDNSPSKGADSPDADSNDSIDLNSKKTNTESAWKSSFIGASEDQSKALKNLAKAIQQLDQQQNKNQNPEQQNPEQPNQEQQKDESQQKTQQQRQQQMNAEQLLQMIRDRESERRKNKKQRVLKSGTVDKDW
jgi:Ca-activated chloride channel family protein